DGQNHDHFKVLALCRKPRAKETFPSLTAEQRAIIENIWFDKEFASNNPTVELLYEHFSETAKERGWETCPSAKTISRYIKYLMDSPGAASAHYLSAKGLQEWKNKKQVKCKRDASTLEVMEYVVADAHTFDVWVQYTTPNGKGKAIRPVLVAWEDVRSRRILGMIVCEHSNTQIVKESFIKMVYEAGCVPLEAHMDNGKDFANHETLGQDRKLRAMESALMDAEEKGFYLAMGVKRWSRSLPFQPWDKPIERAFNTFCLQFSRKFKSYTGTLTASRTTSKIKKDIPRMLERGELLTIDEFMDALEVFRADWYDMHEHRGLKEAGEHYRTPRGVWDNEPHIQRPAPPREYAAMLLMKPAQAKVTTQGITKFKTLYTADELAHYVDQTVGIRWDVDDVRRLYVYDKEGRKVCEACSAELMQFGERVSEAALEELHRRKNRQLSDVRAILEQYRTPPELRLDPSQPAAVGKLDLMIGHAPQRKVVALPTDKEYRSETVSRKKKSAAGDEFLTEKAGAALERLRAMNE
ncbi:transposase, partial [Clostridiaceae bacterium]|nr:transposase [Clostridiaceae bacterium]